MLNATHNIGWKYAYDMLILYVKSFKMGAKIVGVIPYRLYSDS